LSRKRLSVAAAILLTLAASAAAQDKGGEDETGPYEVAKGWPMPWSKGGYVWGSQPAVFAECGVHGTAVGKDGRIYVADRSNRRIQVFDAAGKVLDIWPNLRQPNDIFISADDRVWVVDGTNARLLQFDTEGKRLYWWGAYGVQPGQFWEPHQISVDSEGNLYIADSFGGRTQKYSPSKSGDRAKLLVTPAHSSLGEGGR
jgi:hypothetical protein